ncbi:MAG: ATP-grasp domain-containing protein [Oscillospiraceae bacterium]|nr:ATP-grasp domain-containing protein [Oscillospiraceae bacterium]
MNLGIIHAYPNDDIVISLKDYYLHLFVPIKDGMVLIEKYKKFYNVKVYPINFDGGDETVRKIIEISKLVDLKCFLPLYEGGIIMSSLVSLELGLPFYSLTSSIASRNKYFLKLIMQSSFISTPESIPIYIHTPYKYLQQLLGDKIILKIVDSMNSQAVIIVNNEEEYLKYTEEIFEYLETESLNSEVDRNRFCYGKDSVKVIAQEFCDGKEVNLDVLVCDGKVTYLGIFEKADTKGPFFPESMSFYPSTLNDIQQKDIFDLSRRAVEAMQIINGIAHIEIRYKGDNPKLIDMGLRPGGAYTIRAIKELYNIDIILMVAKLMLESINPVNIKLKDDVAILYGGIIFGKSGIIKNIDGLSTISIPDMKELRILSKKGDRVVAPPFSSQPHLCYYYLQGNHIIELFKGHSLIQDTIKVEID